MAHATDLGRQCCEARPVRLARVLLRTGAVMAVLLLPAPVHAQTLVRGNPPLTQQMVDRVAGLLGEIVGRPLEPQQRERLRAQYVAFWRARDKSEIETLQALDQIAQAMPRATAEERSAALQQLRDRMIPSLRAGAATDPDARWMVEAYDQTQRAASAPQQAAPSAPAADSRAGAAVPAASVPPAAAPAASAPSAASSAATATAPPAVTSTPAATAPPATAAASTVPRAAPNAPGLRYVAPPTWSVERHASGTVILNRAFSDNAEVTHLGTMMLFPPQPAPQGPAAAFEAEWRGKFGGPDGFELGDAVPHYRQRLPSGPVAYYMGVRTWKRIQGTDRQFYLALWMIDLLDGRSQTVALNVEVGRMRLSTDNMNLDDALPQVIRAVAPMLDSLRYPDGRTPGPLFARSEVIGRWTQSGTAFGGSYVNAATGQGVGASFASSGGMMRLEADGRYTARFSSAFNNPVAGVSGVSQSTHSGRWALQQQTLVLSADQQLRYSPNEVVVGAGAIRTSQGSRRMLLTVGPGGQPPWFPLWDQYGGVMNWYTEER